MNMNMAEAIGQRVSRRSYLNTPIASDKIEQLTKSIGLLNDESGLTMEFIEDGSAAFKSLSHSYGMFKAVRSLIVLKGKKNGEHLFEKAGYYGERLVLEATAMGLGTCWVGGTFDRKNGVFKLSENEELVGVITVGNVPDERTFTERLVRKVSHRKTKSIDELLKSDVTPPDWMFSAMEAVQKAPSAINRQSTTFEYKNGVLRAHIPESYRFDPLDMGIAKLHFELLAGGNFELGNDSIYHEATLN